jgi:hypothetical protein
MLDELDEDKYKQMPLTSYMLITTVYEKYIEPSNQDLVAYCLDDTKG